ncbi:hypothetical protein, partial [Enterobacter intestinihominis]
VMGIHLFANGALIAVMDINAPGGLLALRYLMGFYTKGNAFGVGVGGIAVNVALMVALVGLIRLRFCGPFKKPDFLIVKLVEATGYTAVAAGRPFSSSAQR